MDELELTLYFVGYTKEEALQSMPWTDIKSADEYAMLEGGMVFEADCRLIVETMIPQVEDDSRVDAPEPGGPFDHGDTP